MKRYLLRIIEAHLARRHTGVLVQVGPGRVDDCHIVLFVAYRFPSSFHQQTPLSNGFFFFSPGKTTREARKC